jgi:serine/threonine protein kinase
LKKVLIEKYRMKECDAMLLSRFLLRMLRWSPKSRASANDLLND